MKQRSKKGNIKYSILPTVSLLLIVLLLFSVNDIKPTANDYSHAVYAYEKMSQKAENAKTNVSSSSSMDFADLAQTGPDIVAWISCKDTIIDFPVVQGSDNTYYLTHLPNGETNRLGSIYMDYRNAHDFTDDNTILYGHHMPNESAMFSDVAKYKEQAYYDLHPEMMLYTPEGDYRIHLFAGILGNGSTNVPVIFENEEEQLKYLLEIKSKSSFSSSVEINPGEQMITLVTCIYDYDDARYLLFGKLIPVKPQVRKR